MDNVGGSLCIKDKESTITVQMSLTDEEEQALFYIFIVASLESESSYCTITVQSSLPAAFLEVILFLHFFQLLYLVSELQVAPPVQCRFSSLRTVPVPQVQQCKS